MEEHADDMRILAKSQSLNTSIVTKQTPRSRCRAASRRSDSADQVAQTNFTVERYEVRSIIAHEKIEDEIFFWVQWCGYKKPTKEPDTDLRALPAFIKYTKENNLQGRYPDAPNTNQVGHFGTQACNPSEWLDVNKIYERICSLSKTRAYATSLRIHLNPTAIESDTLNLISLDNHAFVVLHLSSIPMVSDGSNASCESEVLGKLSKIYGLRLKHIRTELPVRVDYCGVAAAAISLELLRIISQKEDIAEPLYPSGRLYQLCLKKFKANIRCSAQLDDPNVVWRRNLTSNEKKCNICGTFSM